MAITVRFTATLARAADANQVEVEASDVKTLLNKLKARYAGDPEMLKQMKLSSLIVNDTNVNYLSGLKTTLKDGDVVTLFPPLGGG